jgi:hypothetical protein
MQINDSTSTIDSDDYAGGFAAESGAAREAYETAASCQPYKYLDDQEGNIEFNLLLQITLDIPVDADGIIGDNNNSTDTFASGVLAATAAMVDKTTNVNYPDESSVISDLTGNLSLRGSDKKKEEQTLTKTTTTGEAPGNRPKDTNQTMSKTKTGKRGQTPKSPRSRLKQSTLQGEILAAKDSGIFEHELSEEKIASVTRCAF